MGRASCYCLVRSEAQYTRKRDKLMFSLPLHRESGGRAVEPGRFVAPIALDGEAAARETLPVWISSSSRRGCRRLKAEHSPGERLTRARERVSGETRSEALQ